MRIIGHIGSWEQDCSEIAAREQAWHAHSCKCGSIAVHDEPSSNSHCHTQSADSAMSHTLGDIFEVRSCGAPFSGMNLGTNSSKSASASHPRRRFRTPSRACTHWHRKCPFNGTGSLTKEGVVTCHSQCDVLDKLWEKKTSYGKGREI